MTNAEKFIEVMNATFGAGFTLDNLVRECSPCGALKICDMGCDTFTCDGCHRWWNKEYAAIPEQNSPITLEELRKMDGEPVWVYNCYNGWWNCRVIDCVHAESAFFTDGTGHALSAYGDGWLAYRREPEWATRKGEDTPK